MFVFGLFVSLLLLSNTEEFSDGFCDIKDNKCSSESLQEKSIFYDVNPPEGFNLRRDVYMRFAIMLAEARKHGKKMDWGLVLPPWYKLYHWKSEMFPARPIFWNKFFDIQSLKDFVPVVEIHEMFSKSTSKSLILDRVYILQNFEDAFENGNFEEKWQINDECDYDLTLWGYKNITFKEKICVKFQGVISKLWELLLLHKSDNNVMFIHAEIPLHDNYGSKIYWDCRKSMKFNKKLINIAKNFIRTNLNCNTEKCSTYISAHIRRQDFVRSRNVPSLNGIVKQIDEAVRNNKLKTTKVFIATDGTSHEVSQIEMLLDKLGYQVFLYVPSELDLQEYKDGGVAIIEQIICSHSAFFIGTHESTFSYRIQEEREILGFDSLTTFNRFCPDSGPCEKPSKWTIIH